ncbi:endonuclease/exonuclease/phosphatase family protein [Spirosoma sp. RP8]|uniref:Endonuclease/exonuclease/phosphatase family protein n=1 Tax=Spirosoma liriopis TaxID=2937440 RepID=A0ABT0HUT8_9BACT|nr:endonuclease/exonuclease/phosphatase family protein [Spirosoma liriopis]MCK8495964.1 endonuclease/exonuclease/phosphatase family protein [Spirosoma liriopis]
MSTVDHVLLGYSIFIVIASFLNLIRLDYWWIRMWDFPHLQLTVMAAAGLLSWLWLDHLMDGYRVLIPIGLLLALLYHGWLIYPFTPLYRKQVVRYAGKKDGDELDDNTIRLLVSNVYMENTQVPKVRTLVEKHKPDVVLILEANQKWKDELASIEVDFPHRIMHPLENTYGMLLYSRFPIRHHELRFLIQDDIPSVYAQLELPSGELINFYGVHPMPPSPTEHYRSTERDAELLLVGKEARKKTGPVIVAGDLNDVAWSHTTRLFQRISGLLDPRIGRGLYNTFHAKYFFLRWPLDHVFVSHHFQLQKILRLPNCGSDHFPMFISLTYVPEEEQVIEEIPQPEGNDLEESREKIEEAT